METTVKLRKLFDFSRLPIAIAAAVLIALTFALILMYLYPILKEYFGRQKEQLPVVQEEVFVKPDMTKLKATYLQSLAAIEAKFNEDPTKIRPAYEAMSKVVREFVYKATGIRVDKFTLCEINNTEYKDLAKLVGEYYRPEFDEISEGDVRASLERSRRLVAEWN